MKKHLFIALGIIAAVVSSCVRFDDSDIIARLENHEIRIAQLETLCNQMNTNIASLQILIDAMNDNDYVTEVIPVMEGDTVKGYTVKFKKSGTITIYNGTDGKDGKNAVSPKVGVKADSDGQLYWTIDGLWLVDSNGRKIRASAQDGITPRMKIEDGRWFISLDNGATWTDAGQATGDSMFKDVVCGDETVEFILSDGTTFSIPRNTGDFFTIPYGIIMLSTEFDEVLKGDTLAVDFIVNPSNFKVKLEDISLMVANDIYTKFDYVEDAETGEVTETPFDETAHCDFEVLEVHQSEQYPGAYRVAIAVGGEGNFFDDAEIHLLYGNKDSNGEERYICSNTPFDVYVIPSIGEGLTIASEGQSFYTVEFETRSQGAVKPYHVGLWSNLYKNAGDMRRVYDRTKIKSLALSDSPFTLDDSNYQEYGLLALKTEADNEYWKPFLDEKADYAEFTSSLSARRGSEEHTFEFGGKVYFNVIADQAEILTESAIRAKLAERTYYEYDLKDVMARVGFAGADFSSYHGDATFSGSSSFPGSTFANKGIDWNTFIYSGRFYSYPRINPDGWFLTMTRSLATTQDKDGSFEGVFPPELERSLLNFVLINTINIAEGE